MTFCRESTCWFSSLILSSLATWLTWTFLLQLSSELFSSALELGGFSCKTCPKAFCLYQVMLGTFNTKLRKMFSITVLHKCSSSCLFSDVDLSRVPICWSTGRSSDEPSKQSMCTINEHMHLLCEFMIRRHDMLCVVYYAPGASFSTKRLLSSVIPNILMQESMTFPTVVSFGVLRWTIRSEAATHDTSEAT